MILRLYPHSKSLRTSDKDKGLHKENISNICFDFNFKVKSAYLLCLLILSLLVCFSVSAPAQLDAHVDIAGGKINIGCTVRYGWWNTCNFNNGSCPESSDCQCRTLAGE
jgi:hypothetical protein